MMGASRSSTIVISFLMSEYGMPFEEAWAFTKKKRVQAKPNVGFQEQLRQFEKEIQEDKTRTFK